MTTRNAAASRAHRPLTLAVLAGAGTLVLVGLATACTPAASGSNAGAAATATPGAAASTAGGTSGTGVTASPTVTPSAQSASSAGTNLLAVLAPASVPPVSDECTRPLTHEADGNVQPISCASAVNVDAWNYYASDAGSVLLALGRAATQADVLQAMCHDYAYVYKTYPIVDNVEQIAQDYYGWTFDASALQQELMSQGCATG